LWQVGASGLVLAIWKKDRGRFHQMGAGDDGRLIDLQPQVTQSVGATSLIGRSPQGETEDVAIPEESFEETRFERLLSVGDALCLSANLFPKSLVDHFPDVMIKC
jgi:hypothetical protein